VRALSEQERTLIALRYVADLSQAEIAKMLGIPAGTVGSGLNRARQKLAVTLGTSYQEEYT
jgi:RNA polymerase sigma-70 factor (ECF subfamily)